jgi:aryl-alcohol dehydrogenase-like predicted oxidoreductase
MQVHNLVDLETQLATMRAWKEQGRLRYLGVTHYVDSAFPEVEKILPREQLDFVQINHSIIDRKADERLLPLARDRGVAVPRFLLTRRVPRSINPVFQRFEFG